MQTLTATNARSNLFNILKTTIKGHQQTRITSKEGNVVLISEEDYESIIETAELSAVKGLLKSIQKADEEIQKNELYSISDVF